MTTFGDLAKSIYAWTSRGLVSAMILVAGLAFGRQVLQWWRAGDEPTAAPQTHAMGLGHLGDPGTDHFLEFGGSDWSMARGTAHGDAEAVSRQLQARCAEAIRSCRVPQTPPGPAECDLLRRIASRPPVMEQPGQWRLHALDAGIPMVVGTREVGEGPKNDKVAKTTQRVVTLGMAAPSSEGSWITYTFQSTSPAEGGELGIHGVPIHPRSRKLMAVRAADGAAMATFRVSLPQDEWVRFFGSWLEEQGWEIPSGWVDRGATRSLHGVRPKNGLWERIDVLITSEPGGELTGVVFFTPGFDARR